MPRRFALLISNSQYKDNRLSRLAAPEADANALAKVLKDPQIAGFTQVETLLNRPFADIHEAIVAFFADKQPDDLMLLYFSGHGLLDETRKLFLATVNSSPTLPRAQSIAARFIADEMSESRAKRQVLVLDCCHSGAFSRGVKAALNQSVGTETLFQAEGLGRVVITASDATQYAFENETVQGQGVRSVLTRYLVEGLETGSADTDQDGVISLHDWYQYAYRHVKSATPSQTPMFWSYGQQGELTLARNPYAASRPSASPAARPAPTPGVIFQPPTAKAVRTLVVDQLARGDYDTISEAIKNAQRGDRILIREGIYFEALVIDKPLELVGDGQWGDVQIHAGNNNVIQFKAAAGVVRNLTLRQTGGDNSYAVDISQGRLRLEDCDISSQSLACVGIHNAGTAPVLRGNKIHDGKEPGIYVYDNAQGLIETNEIWDNAFSGIQIRNGAAPTVRGNKIHDGKGGGIFVNDNAQGLIESNEIWGNALSGIEIKTGANPTVRGNKIHDGKSAGIYVYDNAQGLIEANEIWGNALSGIQIRNGANPTVRGNKIHDGKAGGIFVNDNAQGWIETNEIWGNAYTGIEVRTGATPTVRGNRIIQNADQAIWVHDKSGGTFEDNDLRGNKRGAWNISADSEGLVKRKNNREKD